MTDTGPRLLPLLVLGLGVLLAACSSSPSSSPTTTTGHPASTGTTGASGAGSTTVPTSTASAGKPGWIVADWAVAKMEAAGLSPSLVDYFFDNPQTYLIVTQHDHSAVDQQLAAATHVQRFTSFATMQQAFSSGTVTPGTKGILYDNEAWRFTPANEKAAPVSYAQRARALAHQHGMTFVFTPAVNLATLAASTGGGTAGSTGAAGKYGAYLSQDLAARAATASDVLEIQAQQAQATPEFDTFTSQAISQARAANKSALIYVGIGPGPNGRTISAAQILAAYQATRARVDGYWLNIPANNAQCPGCGTAQPQVAVAFLQSLARTLGQPSS